MLIITYNCDITLIRENESLQKLFQQQFMTTVNRTIAIQTLHTRMLKEEFKVLWRNHSIVRENLRHLFQTNPKDHDCLGRCQVNMLEAAADRRFEVVASHSSIKTCLDRYKEAVRGPVFRRLPGSANTQNEWNY